MEDRQFTSIEKSRETVASCYEENHGNNQNIRLSECEAAHHVEVQKSRESLDHSADIAEKEHVISEEKKPSLVSDASAPSIEDVRLKSAIESLLFVAGNPVTLDRLKSALDDVNVTQIEKQLEVLRLEYEARNSGIMLVEVAGGYQLATRPENATWIRNFRSVKTSSRLSRPALETLAIVAYKQPITRAEVESLRGVNVGGIVRNLMERRLVKIVGKKDVPGKPMLYGTTQEFLQYFGLKDLSSLPTLKEFQELDTNEEIMSDVNVEEADSHQEKILTGTSADSDDVSATQEKKQDA